MQELAELLAIALEECWENKVEYEKIDASNSEEFLGTLSAFTLLNELQDDDILLQTLGFEDTAQAARLYRKQHGTATPNALTKKECPTLIATTSKVVAHLNDLLWQMTIGLWNAHSNKDRARKAKAGSKVSTEKFVVQKKNEDMQTQIVKAEKEDHDAKERSEIPPIMVASMKKYVAAEVKKQLATLKNNEQAKGSESKIQS